MTQSPPRGRRELSELTKDELGLVGEQYAEGHLVANGHIVIERRWRSPQGELDLITLDEDVLVGVEVKTRRGRGYGHPFEAVSAVKLHRLHRLVREYSAEHVGSRIPLRIDAVAVILHSARGEDAGGAAAQPQIEHLEDLRP